MKSYTGIQILKNIQGMPEFVVIPYIEYLALSKSLPTKAFIPHAVMVAVVIKGVTPIRAWREYLNLTQADVAKKMGITQAAFHYYERKRILTKTARTKLVEALEITIEQLDF